MIVRWCVRNVPVLRSWRASLVLLIIGSINVALAQTSDQGVALGPGYGPLKFTLPAPGTYKLSDLGAAPDGALLDSSGNPTSLHDVFPNRITLLSFMYSSCNDVNGCPLSAYVFHQIKSAMQDDPALADNLRLVSMSFDPEYDTPERMKLYEANYRFAGPLGEWQFFTTESIAHLAPILSDYGQDVEWIAGATPEEADEISHLLRVYLVDTNQRIRNIYSVAFLHADVLLNDVRTLLAEADAESVSPAPAPSIQVSELSKPADTRGQPTLARPGDDKTGYDSLDYTTNSVPLADRVGQPTDLLALALNPPTGLPAVPVPADNPLTEAKVALGRKLFYDRRLSINETFSCAMCHVPEQGFASNELATAVGVEGRTVRRNSLTLYNVAYATRLFHDGREENLEQQVWSPLLARNEMANPSIGYLLQKIRGLSDYDGLFEQAFEGSPVSMLTVSKAFASYERTLVSANSRFDRWYFDKQADALDASEQRGFELFTGKGACSSCHTINTDSALLTDYAMHNTGLGYANSLGVEIGSKPKEKTQRILFAPGIYIDVENEIIESAGEAPPSDVGLYEVTEEPDDRWKYRTPSLRNVALTAPYMHNGQFLTLREVVEFYNRGGVANPLLDPLIRPLGLSDDEIDDLVAFMRALTGSNVDELVSDAFAAPIGDPLKQEIQRASQ